MAFAAPFLSVAGPVIGAAGSLVSGAASANAADYQAQVASNNAIQAGQNAAYSTAAGRVASEQKSRQGAEKQAAIKTAMAANGVDVNTGSAVTVQEGARENAVADTEATMHDATLKAYGYRTQQTGFEAESELDKSKATDAEIGSYFDAAGSLLGNAKGIGGTATSAASSIGSLFSSSYGLPTTPY